ncbi:MAG TPA: tetratricopeptide repeat protein [Pirellulales bacterium]|nr:tetratricopeptide repeat protein [Pirellulales bacterium]
MDRTRHLARRRRLAPRLAAGILAAVCLAPVGCRLHRGAEPVSRSLVQCRQLSQQGLRALERKDLPQAEALLAEAVEACPVDPEARQHYAEALWQRDKQDQALLQLDEAVRLSSDDSRLLAHAAEKRLSLGQERKALELAERAIDLDPKNAAAWFIRGRVRRRSGMPQEALSDFHRALGFEPDNRDCMREIADVYQQLRRPQQCLAACQMLCDTYPPGEEPQQVLYQTGLAYNAVGRSADALEYLRAARNSGPASSELLFQLADAELRSGRSDEARLTARQALELQPGHTASLALLERLDLAQRDPRRSAQ